MPMNLIVGKIPKIPHFKLIPLVRANKMMCRVPQRMSIYIKE